MKYIKEIFTDTLTLDSVKEHLNVTFNEDDSLIESYINASLVFVEKSSNRILKPLTYVMQDDESEPFIINDEYKFCLHLANRPLEVIIDSVTYTELDENYEYDYDQELLIIDYDENIVDISAICGSLGSSLSDVDLTNQARLLLIGNWYAFRESDIIGSVKELPNGVGRIIDILTASSI